MRRAAAAASDWSMRCGGTAWPIDSRPALWLACWLSSRDGGEARTGAIEFLTDTGACGARVLDFGRNAACWQPFPSSPTALGKAQIPAQPAISVAERLQIWQRYLPSC